MAIMTATTAMASKLSPLLRRSLHLHPYLRSSVTRNPALALTAATALVSYLLQLLWTHRARRVQRREHTDQHTQHGQHKPHPEFTDAQLQTLLAIADTLLPALSDAETAALMAGVESEGEEGVEKVREALRALARERPSEVPEFVETIGKLLPKVAPRVKVEELKAFLGLLSFRATAVMLTGRVTLFQDLGQREREEVLLGWKHSRFETLRRVFDSLTSLILSSYIRTSSVAEDGMQFPCAASAAAVPRGQDFAFTFLPPSASTLTALPAFDAIIIGSGSGGGVAAKTLSEAGMRVLVVEKGSYIPGAQALSQAEAMGRRYERQGLHSVSDGRIALLTASTFGGGSAINWAASLQTPMAVREEWAAKGLPLFTSEKFQESLDSVCKTMGVTLPSTHNAANTALLAGAAKLGLPHAAVPQNTGGSSTHACNHHCASGCLSGQKQGGPHCWLRLAAEHGAQFLVNTACTRIAFSPSGAATGVHLRLPNSTTDTFLPCSRIIIAAGSLQTPALLLRSGHVNPHLGRNLHLHPTALVHARFPTRVNPYDGNILTSVITAVPDAKLEAMCMLPFLHAPLLPWRSGTGYKALLAAYPRMPCFIAITRDRDAGGTVALDGESGEPVVAYQLSPRDAGTLYTAVAAMADVLLASGAERVVTNIRGLPDLDAGTDAAGVAAWKKELAAKGPGDAVLGSAHQMGSCRMGASAAHGVVDAHGRVWGKQGVWVADASVFPGACGVNPMVGVMAVAQGVAGGVVGGWKKEVGQKEGK
ncbi:hypothetical protein EDC01DRAFT_427426 [Geopyxis carbonaria]|nr:hypothetical protein EDC01DRAFT_427426 [Geopyxis carbonaria]